VNTEKDLYLILQNGDVFPGKSVGAYRETVGEVVFTTGMTGYLETLTDPSYYGQIITQTFPQIGNYGVTPDGESSRCFASAYIIRDLCDHPSNFRSEGELRDFFVKNDIIAMSGVNTRSLTKIVRERGVMNGMISFNPRISPEQKAKIEAYTVRDASDSVSCKAPAVIPAEGEKLYRVVLMDLGAKRNIARILSQRGCEVYIVPAGASAEDVLSLEPDGIMLSNGPGDPAENTSVIREVAKLMDKHIPIFGICLGHQIMALATGAKTIKLKYGHRGANQPVEILDGGRLLITSQNHGYAVDNDSVKPDVGVVSIINANDKTCEGINYIDRPAYSVQFHPEAAAGTHDTRFLFNKFIDMLNKNVKRL
jgi:carbamoyl-phosphate synthase small subunit